MRKQIAALIFLAAYLTFNPTILGLSGSAWAFSGSGVGTAADPYVITNVQQLQEMADDLAAYYTLGNDIDASDTVNWNGGEGFLPVGIYTGDPNDEFRGSLDGLGYSIQDLYIDRINSSRQGLFGFLSNATIKNVNLINATVSADRYTGILAGTATSNSTITYCSATGTVTLRADSNDAKSGGLIGSVNKGSKVQECFSGVNVNANDRRQVGGLVGYLLGRTYYALIRNSYSTGTVAGGGKKQGNLVGDADGSYVDRCYSCGNGKALIGYNYSDPVITNCYWDKDKGASSSPINYGGTPKTTAEMMQQATFVGWDFVNTWDIVENSTYPFLSLQGPVGSGLVAHWKFDEGSGSTTYDSAGGNHGTIHGAMWVTGCTGIALDFDGGDYVEVNDDPSLRFTQYDSFSICSWAKPVKTVEGNIVCKMRAAKKYGYFGYNIGHTTTNKYYFTAEKSMFDSVSVHTQTIPLGDWSHVAAVYDYKDMRIYLDGELEDAGHFTLNTGSKAPDKDLAIGARSLDWVIDQHFTGIIDDVRIYDRALFSEEVRHVYESTLTSCAPIIWTSAKELAFFAYESGSNPESQSLSIRNLGKDVLNWEIAEDCGWLSVVPNSGCLMWDVNDVSISVDITGLGAGSYNCELVISDPNAANNPQTVNVNLLVQGPIIDLSVAKLQFRALEKGANPADQILGISNIGGSTLNWTASHDCNWLSVEPDHGSSTGNVNDVTISVDISSLSSGIHNCDLIISDPNAENNPQTIAVELLVLDYPIFLNYYAEVYAYSHTDYMSSDTDTDEDFSNNSKARAQARAHAVYCDYYPINCSICWSSASNMDVSGEGIYGPDMAYLTSRFMGSGSWSIRDSCSGSEDRQGGGDGSGYTSIAGTLTIGIFEGYPQGSQGLTLKVSAEIFGDAPGRWNNWDWWLNIWDDDPNNPVVLLNDSNMSANLDVLAGQVFNFEFYHEAGDEWWPEAGLESTVVINLYLPPPLIADLDNDCDIDFFDYAWFAMGRSIKYIPKGSVVVDGNLGDWPESVVWRELDKIYWGSPSDVIEARFALQWDDDTDKVYAAVVINDTDHVFLDEYITWDASDRLEVYSQGDAEGGAGWKGIYDVAQQYYVAPDTSDGNWATWGNGGMLDENAGLEYAVDVKGTQITYEVGVRQFDNYGGFSGGDTVVTDLHVGRVVGFDVVACTRWDTVNFGMLSENLMTGKHKDAGKFARYILVEKTSPADLEGNGVFNYADIRILFENWLDCYPTKATDPVPANNTIDVDPGMTLSWWPGGGALYHDVYLGTDANAVANADQLSPEFMGTVSEAHFHLCDLDWATMYYWRIDEVGQMCLKQGEVWSFTIDVEPNLHLVGWWKFDEGSGATAYDLAGSNDGTISGAAWTSGQINGALSFDGVDDYVDMADTVKNYLGTDYTVSAWINTKTISGVHCIAVYRRSTLDIGYQILFSLYHYNGDIQFAVGSLGNIAIASYPDALTINTWYHIAGVREGNVLNVYVNSVSGIPDSKTFGIISPDNLKIGAIHCCGHAMMSFFDGTIDDIRVYDRALSANEIQELYQAGLLGGP